MRLPKGYDVPREPLEKPFTLSFLPPIGPVDPVDLGRLGSNTGCVMCGEKTNKSCAGCYATYYCDAGGQPTNQSIFLLYLTLNRDKECQRAHWKEHKPTCKTLKGATWTPIAFKYRDIKPNQIFFNFHSKSRVADLTASVCGDRDNNTPPDNTHGMQPFTVKIQCSSTDAHQFETLEGMMLYDRKRSLDVVYPPPEENTEGQKVFEDVFAKF